MRWILQVMVLAIALSLFLQRSAGSNISPSPSILVAIPPIEGLPVIPIPVIAPNPVSLPNVSQLPPVVPPVKSTPGPDTGNGKGTAPPTPPSIPPPLPSQELVPPPSANAPNATSPSTSPPSPSQELVPPPSANAPNATSPSTPPPSPSQDLVPPPSANAPNATSLSTPPPSPSQELVPPPSANAPNATSPSTSPPSPSQELVPPPSANAPNNQDPISNSPKPVPIPPVPVTTPPPSSPPLKPPVLVTTPPPSNSPQEPPSVNPVVPRVDPPSSRPSIAPTDNAPPLKPNAPEPVISTVSTPPPSPSKKIDGAPVASPPNKKFHSISPQNSSPLKAPPVNKDNSSRQGRNVAPLSSPKSSPVTKPQAPAPLPSTPSNHGKHNITTPPPSPFQFLPPPPPSHITIAPPPKEHEYSRKKGHTAPPSPSPSATVDILPDSTPPPGRASLPILSPKASPAAPSPTHTKHQLLPPIRSLPPPPPNEDCSPLTCTAPYTNTPPGSPCGCVWPMQVGLRLGVALYTFFPLVSEFAEEISIGGLMKQSQVRIMGANAASQDPGKTIVLVDLVPLGNKFDNTTAFLTADRIWNKQVAIQSSLFGNYDVLYVRYPGLPPSPPSSIDIINGEPYIGQGGNARAVKPVGVDVSAVHHKKNGLNGSVVAIVVLSASVILILSIAALWVLLSKRRQCQQGKSPRLATLPFLPKPSGNAGYSLGIAPSSESLSIVSSMAPYTGSAKTLSASDIEKATDNFDETKVLGEGGFGRVYSGVLEDGTKVAVKVLKRDDQQGGREFLAEVEMLSRLHHRHLVKLIGICTEDRARCLVYELVPNGSVESHLHGADKEIAPLDWASRLKIALGAARALAYLHEDSSPRVIHRDFKSSNILLEDDFTPKVSDFGLARTALEEENKHISTRVMGTFGYVAPEYAMTGHLLVKSDVYSYGVVLLELLTGKKPVDMSQPPGQESLVAWARPLLTNQESLESIIDSSLGPNFPFDSIAKVSAIASMCVQPEVSHRPFMGEVVQALRLVCNECDVAREMESRSCSLDDLSSTNSPISNYEGGIDVESGYSGSVSDIFRFKRLEKQNSDSFRRHSSSGPLRTARSGDGVWRKLRRFSGGTVSEHAINFRFWSGSH